MNEFKEGDEVYFCVGEGEGVCSIVKEKILKFEDYYIHAVSKHGCTFYPNKNKIFHRLEDLLGHLVKDLPEAKNIRITL